MKNHAWHVLSLWTCHDKGQKLAGGKAEKFQSDWSVQEVGQRRCMKQGGEEAGPRLPELLGL